MLIIILPYNVHNIVYSQILIHSSSFIFATIKLIDEGNCAWESPTVYEILAQCKDLEYCNILLDPFCCSKHNGRLKCPEKYPVMCENKLCLNNTEHCCTGPHLNCGTDKTGYHGGPRSCGMNGSFHIIMVLSFVSCINPSMYSFLMI